MTRTIAILNGHPDPSPDRLCHALTQAYATGAQEAGHRVERIDVAGLAFPLLRSVADFESAAPPETIARIQRTLDGAAHWLILYPLWLGGMPALLKGLLEQVLRPDFAFERQSSGFPRGRLKGHSARIVVTMGMPALAYRWWFGAHSLKSLERNILKFSGVSPVRETLFGSVGSASEQQRAGWLDTMLRLGRDGA